MNTAELPKSQANAVARFVRMMQESVDRANAIAQSEGTKQALEVEVMTMDYGAVWISLKVTYPNAKGTLLSAIGTEYWHVHVGKRGALTAWSYPNSVKQFAGRKWCGVNIHKE